MVSNERHVAIIGGGVIGLSAALTAALEDNGASVNNPVSGRPAGRASVPDGSVIQATRSNPRS